jgi:hypothetical protein
MQIYLDESGDLGWKFDAPNQDGGSSRFITIAGFVIDINEIKFVNRQIAKLYKKYNLTPKQEKKGANFSDQDATYIVSNLNAIFDKAPSFKVISITTKKENVQTPLRKDCNIFYNYMLRVLLPDTMKLYPATELVIDKRTIRVDSGNSFEDYIKTICWGEMNLDIDISCSYDSSDKNEGIWLADWLANWIWRHYENGRSVTFAELSKLKGSKFFEKTLYF